MFIRYYKDIEEIIPDEPGLKGVKMRRVISEKEGAPNFIMRVFEIEPGGYTPLHRHSWEHEVFVLQGTGAVISRSETKSIRPGDVIFVAPEEDHQFKNDSQQVLEFICLIPRRS